MNARAIIDRLEPFPACLRALTVGLAPEDLRWRPADGSWSILEILCHIADEEHEDFRPRLEKTLRDPGEAWAPLDLEGVAARRRYNERDVKEALDRFALERAASVKWLRSLDLDHLDFGRAHPHPKFGPISAVMLLCGWAAHDALHLRQIAKRMFELAGRDGSASPGKPGDTSYAGEWKA